MSKIEKNNEPRELGFSSVMLADIGQSVSGTFVGVVKRKRTDGDDPTREEEIEIVILKTEEGNKVGVRLNKILAEKMAEAEPGMKLKIELGGKIKCAKGFANDYRVFVI